MFLITHTKAGGALSNFFVKDNEFMLENLIKQLCFYNNCRFQRGDDCIYLNSHTIREKIDTKKTTDFNIYSVISFFKHAYEKETYIQKMEEVKIIG